jgi:hypothetical protein
MLHFLSLIFKFLESNIMKVKENDFFHLSSWISKKYKRKKHLKYLQMMFDSRNLHFILEDISNLLLNLKVEQSIVNKSL